MCAWRCRWDNRFEFEPPPINHSFASRIVLGSDAGQWQTSSSAADACIRRGVLCTPAIPEPVPRSTSGPTYVGRTARSLPPVIASPRPGDPVKGELPGKVTLFDSNFSFVHHEPPRPAHYRKDPRPMMATPTAPSEIDRRFYRRSVLLREARFQV